MIRQTKQREAIMQALEEAKRPLSPPELHELARKYFPRLGLRTVYRNIREMVQEGRVVGVDYPGQPLRYEPTSDEGHRPHFLCRHCDRVFVLEVEVPDVKVQAPAGFEVSGQELILFGMCPECRQKQTSSGSESKPVEQKM